jgi:regulatory protein
VTQDAFGAAVDALARRDLTSAELEQRLARAGFEAESRADAIERAASAGYVDDVRVAAERARRLADRNASDAAIRAELLRRGVEEDAVETALEALPPEQERAERLALRLGGGPRAGRALARKGYPEDVVARALRQEIAE